MSSSSLRLSTPLYTLSHILTHTHIKEAWSEGIESEVIEFLATVYELLVFGETLGPDGSILTPPSATQRTGNDHKGPGPGFGSMSGWQGPGRGGNSSSSNSNSNSSNNGRNNSNSNLSGQVSSMLSDLPRQVCFKSVTQRNILYHTVSLNSIWTSNPD